MATKGFPGATLNLPEETFLAFRKAGITDSDNLSIPAWGSTTLLFKPETEKQGGIEDLEIADLACWEDPGVV